MSVRDALFSYIHFYISTVMQLCVKKNPSLSAFTVYLGTLLIKLLSP